MAKPRNFTQAEMRRVVEAARASGMEKPVPVVRRLADGTEELTARNDNGETGSPNEWDKALGIN